MFAAWADPAAKGRWFRGPEDWTSEPHQLDFRVGGREHSAGGPSGGPIHVYVALYWDIVEDRRIVYTYEMLLDDTRISVSMTSVELEPDGEETLLRLTEHGVFFNGHEPAAERADGVGSLLDALAAELEHGPADARNPPRTTAAVDATRPSGMRRGGALASKPDIGPGDVSHINTTGLADVARAKSQEQPRESRVLSPMHE